MATSSTRLFKNFPIGDIVYKAPQKNSRGGLNLYLDESPDVKRNPKFQLAECRAPFGVSLTDFQGDPVVSNRKNMELSLDDPELRAWLELFDQQNIQVAAENSKTWFAKELTAAAISTLYRPAANPSKNEEYAPMLRIKVCDATAKKPTNIYIIEKGPDGKDQYRQGTMEEVTKGSTVVAIVELGGLWFVSRGFGTIFVATDLLVRPGATQEEAFPFIVDSAMLPVQAQQEQEQEQAVSSAPAPVPPPDDTYQ